MRRFPVFKLPALKFLMSDLKKIQDFVVLVRITPRVTRMAYVESVTFLVFFFCGLGSLACFWILLALNNAPQLLFTFLARDGWMLLAALYTGYTIPPRLQPYAVLFWGIVAFVFGTFWMLSQMRRTIREARGLLQMHTMTEKQRAQFSLDRFLHVSLPLWMSTSVSYTPTPEELLTLLREREQATQDQTEALISVLPDEPQHDEEQDEAPSISQLLTLTDCISLSLLESGDKRVTVVLSNAVASLVGFLATRERGVFTPKEDLLKEVYDPGKEGVFAMHRARTNEQILKRAREAEFLFLEDREQNKQVSNEHDPAPLPSADAEEMPASEAQIFLEAAPTRDFDLFEHQTQGQATTWKLTHDCNIEVFPILSFFYQKVIEAQALSIGDASAVLSLEQLRQGCHRVIDEYGEGFLASHMKKGHVWSWALPFYTFYREQCLSVLSYANQREREYLGTCQTNQERFDAIEHIAQLYGWQAVVATGLDLKDRGVYSEHDMERCLYYYGKLQKRSTARAIYQRYCTLRSRIDPTYEPGETLSMRAQKVITPNRGKRSRRAESM